MHLVFSMYIYMMIYHATWGGACLTGGVGVGVGVGGEALRQHLLDMAISLANKNSNN